MSTSLAEQLQRLAAPQTSILERSTKRASLLFNPKDAASLRRETVLEIGLLGLEELISKNEDFEQFSNTLFSLNSKDFERSMQSAESNEKLDRHIRKFFLLLSPYFLLNCSYKALEWLIYRYSIHEYNKEDILILALPYHESNIFARVVQILKIRSEGDPWFFLKAIQKPGVHLAKQTLLTHAASDPYFVKLISEFILDLIKIHKTPNTLTVAFNFYCSVYTGAIEFSKEVSESLVSQMLPSLLKGLKSDIPDFRAASYVVTARLLTKCTLSEVLLDKFMTNISNHKVETLKQESILLYIVLYQSQIAYKHVPDVALFNITGQEWFSKVLQNLNATGCLIYPFLEALIECSIKKGVEEDEEDCRIFLLNLFDQLHIDDDYVPTCLNAVLDSLPSKLKKKTEDVRVWLTTIIEKFEKQYPTSFDKHVYQILVSTDKRKSTLQKILKNAFTLKEKFDIFNKLYHPNPYIRSSAMKFVTTNFENLRDVERDVLKISLEDRLRDEDVNVVKEALEVIETTGIVQDSQLNDILIQLLYKYYEDKNKWEKVMKKLIPLICTESNSKIFKVILNIFPLLLPLTQQEIILAKLIVNTELFLNCGFFTNFDVKSDLTVPGDFLSYLLNSLHSIENKNILIQFFCQIEETDYENYTPLQIYIAALISKHVGSEHWSLDEFLPVLECLEKFFKKTELKSHKKKNSILGNLKICKKGKLPVNGFLECLTSIIEKVEKIGMDDIDFSIPNNRNKFLISTTSILYFDNDIHSEYIDSFNNSLFKDYEERIDFMLHLANFKSDITDKIEILTILSRELGNTNFRSEKFFDLKKNFVPYLLILLNSSDQNIRKKVIKICEKILQKNVGHKISYFNLVSYIIQHQEEIILDSKQLPLIVYNILSLPKEKEVLSSLVELCSNFKLPLYSVAGILQVLSGVNSVSIFEKTSKVANAILEKKLDSYNEFESQVIVANIHRFDGEIGKSLKKEMQTVEFFLLVMKNDKQCLDNNENVPSLLLLNNLNELFFSSLPKEIELLFLDSIIDISTNTPNPKVVLAANKLFKHINLDVQQIIPQLIKMKDIQSKRSNVGRRNRTTSVIPSIDILDTIEWKKGVRVLELIQDKKKLSNFDVLLPILFDILKKCLDFDEQSAVEYPKQLILSLILHVCRKLEGEKIAENVFNMDSVVQCIRASTNPQTHHHALLVLAHCASLIPTQVLHHIMAIFTFMGSSVLRHDDAYSFQLISNVIETVIPILITDNNTTNIISVLRVFVDTLLDVPEHRRMALYTQFLHKIDPKQHLYIFLLLVFISHVLHSPNEKTKSPKNKFEDNSVLKRLAIAEDLTRQFSPDIIFATFINLIHYLRSLPIDQNDIEKDEFDVDPSHLTPKQFRHFRYTILLFMNNLTSSQEFINKIALLEDDKLEALETYYKDVIVGILSYIQKTYPILDKFANTNQAQYWKAIQHQSLEILDGMNALLTSEMFLLVIKGLMTHNLIHIKQRALDLLNIKLQHNSSFIDGSDQEQIFSILNPLLSIIDKLTSDDNEDELVVIQTALLSLKLIIKNVGNANPDKYVSILEFITNIIVSEKAQGNVLASLILCLAELCVTLRARAIQSLPNFMPILLKILKQQKNQDSPTLLCLSVLTVLGKVLDSLSLFISPYLKRLLTEISQLICKWGSSTEDAKLSPFVNKLNSIRQKLGEIIAPRILIPAIEESYADLIEKNKFEAIGSLMKILSQNISTLKGDAISHNLPHLTKFFIIALDFRNQGHCELELTNTIENDIIEALATLVLKLSETTFRVLYYEINDWAIKYDIQKDPSLGNVDELQVSIKNDRIITFYNVSCSLANNLKGLFILFAGVFLDNAAQVLDACNKIKSDVLYFEDQRKNVLLLEKVLQTLTSVFKHTTTKFIDKKRFELLMQPLVDQLENDFDGIEQLEKRNDEVLTPCIVQFAVATADDSLWKQMNYQVLLKMRHTIPKIRLIGLRCLTAIVSQLGDDFLPLLPETIPFLAELMEDEVEEVEENCKKAIREMEKILGESLQKYF